MLTVDEQERLDTWTQLSATFVESSEYEEGIDYFKSLLQDKGRGKLIDSCIYNIIGYIALKKKDYELAINYRKRALFIRKSLNMDYYVCESLNDLAVVYYAMNEYESSKEYYMQSLQFVKENEIKAEFGIIYCNVACLFYKILDFDNSILYFSKAIELFNKLSLTERLSEAYYNIGLVLYLADKHKKALEAFHKSFLYYKNEDNNTMPALCEKRIADIYFEQNRPKKAKDYYESCLKHNVSKVDTASYYDTLQKLKQIRLQLGK